MDKEQFEKFSGILEGKQGCNFTKSGTWECHHDYRFTKKILKKHFKNINVKEFIEFCKNNGGYCDCEILFNVEVGDKQ